MDVIHSTCSCSLWFQISEGATIKHLITSHLWFSLVSLLHASPPPPICKWTRPSLLSNVPCGKTLRLNYKALHLQPLQPNVKERARMPCQRMLTHWLVAQQVVDRLLTLEEYRASKHVSVYISMPSGEVDTRAIIRDLLHSGMCIDVWHLYVPGANIL